MSFVMPEDGRSMRELELEIVRLHKRIRYLKERNVLLEKDNEKLQAPTWVIDPSTAHMWVNSTTYTKMEMERNYWKMKANNQRKEIVRLYERHNEIADLLREVLSKVGCVHMEEKR